MYLKQIKNLVFNITFVLLVITVISGLLYYPGELSRAKKLLSEANTIVSGSEKTIKELRELAEERLRIIGEVQTELQKAIDYSGGLEQALIDYSKTTGEHTELLEGREKEISDLIRLSSDLENEIIGYWERFEEIKKSNEN